MHFNVALDLLSTQMTYPSLPEFLELFYEGLVGEWRPYWDFVIRSGAVGLIILTLYFNQDEGTDFNLDFNAGCTMFLSALVFIVPALFVFVIGLLMVIVGFIELS